MTTETNNNQPGSDNSGQQQAQNDSTNNTGQQASETSSFWETPKEPSAQTNQNAEYQTTLSQQIAATVASFGSAEIVTDSVFSELAEGKYENFNKAIGSSIQRAVQESVQLNTQIMQTVITQLMGVIDEKLNGTLNQKDNERALLEAIPSAADPEVRPVVDMVYQQALKLEKGNAAKALARTKDMMKLFFNKTSGDIDLPPDDLSGRSRNGPSIDWKQLMGL